MTRHWWLLAAAIVAEVAGTMSLRAALDHGAWYAVVVLGYVASFVLLARILAHGVAVGVVYGIWAASGVALTAVLASLVFDEHLTLQMVAGIGLVIVGVLLVETGSRGSHGPIEPAAEEASP